MTAVADTDDLDDLLPDDLKPDVVMPASRKGAALPVRRTPAQQAAVAKRAAADAAKQQLTTEAARLAQIVNLHIGGYSLPQIAGTIGATVEEVERMLTADVARYVRSQPALRTYVRNWVSERYMKMIEADWSAASDPDHKEKLEHQDRVLRILNNMAKLHGAEAPTQAEVKVEAAPETVNALVERIAQAQGMGYDDAIFDVDPSDIHEVSVSSASATVVSGNALEQRQDGETDDGF